MKIFSSSPTFQDYNPSYQVVFMDFKKIFLFTTFLIPFVFTHAAFGFERNAFFVGFGYFSQSFLNATSQKEDNSTRFFGEPSYPLNLIYDLNFSGDWYFAPQLSYTLFPRSTPGNTSKVTITHFVFQFGKNFGNGFSSNYDWYVGPGLLRYDIKGAGGTTVMSNGTSTATFAIPGNTSTVQKVSFNFGGSLTYEKSRFGLDFIIENLFSGKKRTQDFMFSYSYQFSGGFL